jgi:hypothetical protein
VASGQHARVNAGTTAGPIALLVGTNARQPKMPLLFYFPFIVWMGMMEIVYDEMRVPVRIKAPAPRRL